MRSDGTGGWAVPWSDLMMVMFTLFVVLFVTKTHEVEAKAAPGGSELLERLAASVDRPYPGFEVVLRSDASVQVSLPGTLFFDQGSAALSPPAREVLDRLALALADGDFEVEVTGHTDDTPTAGDAFTSNWEFSAARAAAVARALIRGSRIDPSRFTVSGRGMYAPLEPNTTPLGRARNRRVEVVVGLPGVRS